MEYSATACSGSNNQEEAARNNAKKNAERDFYLTIASQIARYSPEFGKTSGHAEIMAFFMMNHAQKTYKIAAHKDEFLEFYLRDPIISETWQHLETTYNTIVKPQLNESGKPHNDSKLSDALARTLAKLALAVEKKIIGLVEKNALLPTTIQDVGFVVNHGKATRENPDQPCPKCTFGSCGSRESGPTGPGM